MIMVCTEWKPTKTSAQKEAYFKDLQANSESQPALQELEIRSQSKSKPCPRFQELLGAVALPRWPHGPSHLFFLVASLWAAYVCARTAWVYKLDTSRTEQPQSLWLFIQILRRDTPTRCQPVHDCRASSYVSHLRPRLWWGGSSVGLGGWVDPSLPRA